MEITTKFDPNSFEDIQVLQEILNELYRIRKPKENVEFTDRQQREMELTNKVASAGVDWLSNSDRDKDPTAGKEVDESFHPNTIVDANGDTWDEAIHSSSKSLNADGTWKKRRGSKIPPAPPATAEIPEPPLDEPQHVDPEFTIDKVITRITDQIKAGKIVFGDVNQALKINGIENFFELAHHPDKWLTILEQLGA